MLNITNLHASYGGSRILQGVNLQVAQGQIMALMGRNGMGKTTLMRTIMGLLRPSSGHIIFDGKPIQGRQSYKISSDGIGYVPQGREIFGDFTVAENLRLGALKFDRKNRDIPEEIFDYFPILAQRQDQLAGSFSGGEQQMLAIARALVGRPKLLLLDEPSEGIQPSIVDEIGQILKKINSEAGLTILIVEQNVDMVLEIADNFSFMEKGIIVHNCPVQEIKADESIITGYISV
ncbi:urea ABC transporter ATP-binding subunit UrtE [Desulfobacula sp.]|uniref:urea ABC transporter ATP-binding subunit UrtE n=1 Tax=Desulfobacula sp. TaxID=2593537 RepID=UPI002616274B|nr:urea ABC transporter ATP-binding subunit UrtE [Desulfobacula sp.]